MSFALYQLRAWQTLKISGVVYTVKGMIEFRQGSYAWKEYALSDSEGKRSWLSVEGDESIPLCALFQPVEANVFTPDEHVVYEGRRYARSESGRAEVIDSFGLPDVQIADVVEFEEYRSESGLLLSCERWSDKVEYSAGAELPKTRIGMDDGAFVAEQKPALPKPSYTKMTSLPLGQELRIRGATYSIQGYVRYRQKGFTWMEYKISPSSRLPGLHGGSEEWLCVERGQGDGCALSLHRSIPFPTFSMGKRRPDKTIVYAGVVYDWVEEGKGKVTACGGDVDFDDGEAFAFTEYRSRDNATLTCEFWEDEQEASLGEELREEDVTVLDSRKRSVFGFGKTFSPRKPDWMRGLIVSIALALILISEGIFLFSSARPLLIERQLASNPSFIPVTSVTLQGDKKAQVYSTPLSLDDACLAVIRMDPENVQYVTTTAEDPEKGERILQTARETVMIYESESGDTYVQVSANTPREGRYTAYRPRNPLRMLRLYRGSREWYGSRRTTDTEAQGIDTSRYSPFVASARQASVAARRSSGGGRRFGK
jgi:hypothetical protein